jgi:hypothetical protein
VATVVGRLHADLHPQQIGVALEDVRTFERFGGGFAGNVGVGLARLGVRAGRQQRGDAHLSRAEGPGRSRGVGSASPHERARTDDSVLTGRRPAPRLAGGDQALLRGPVLSQAGASAALSLPDAEAGGILPASVTDR